MPDRGHHGEGEHDERDVTMPAVPGTALVVVEAEFVLGRLETILDRPAVSFDLDQGLDARSVGTPGGEEGHIVIGDVARITRPRVHRPVRSSSSSAPSRSANSP